MTAAQEPDKDATVYDDARERLEMARAPLAIIEKTDKLKGLSVPI